MTYIRVRLGVGLRVGDRGMGIVTESLICGTTLSVVVQQNMAVTITSTILDYRIRGDIYYCKIWGGVEGWG